MAQPEASYVCPEESRLKTIESTLKRHSTAMRKATVERKKLTADTTKILHIIEGNGKTGLSDIVADSNACIKILNGKFETLEKKTKDLMEFKKNKETQELIDLAVAASREEVRLVEEKHEKARISRNRWMIGAIIIGFSAVSTFIFAIIEFTSR